jgi:hypothetical protein
MTKSEELVILQKRIPDQQDYINKLIQELIDIKVKYAHEERISYPRYHRLRDELLPQAEFIYARLLDREEMLLSMVIHFGEAEALNIIGHGRKSKESGRNETGSTFKQPG